MSGRPKYTYSLSSCEREELELVITSTICSKEKRLRAYILLKCDSNQEEGCWSEAKLIDAYNVSSSKIYHTRKLLVEDGLDAALTRKIRLSPPTARKLDGEGEAHLTVLACSESPDGSNNWTLELLAAGLVRLKIVDSISRECVRQTLKKRT